jgi:hypothetical protein
LIPAGLDVTVPVPLPAALTVSVCWSSTKVAVTALSAAIETVQVPAPLQPPPDHPANVEPVLALAVRVTLVG